MSAAERMRRYRLRRANRPDGTRRVCLGCGARISMYAPLDEFMCCACGNGRNRTCKRGHDLDAHARQVTRGNRTTIICAECKRHRDAGYARERRAREAT